MSWFSGLADKTENLLNKFDQNVGNVVRKKNDSPSIPDAPLLEISSEDAPLLTSVTVDTNGFSPPSVKKASLKLVSAQSTPSHSTKSSSNKKKKSVDSLMEYLNDSEPNQLENPALVNSKLEPKENEDKVESDLQAENQLLRNEIRSLNNELALLLHRTRASEEGMNKMKNDSSDLEDKNKKLNIEIQSISAQLAEALETTRTLQAENQRLLQVSHNFENETSALVAAQKQISDLRTDSERSEELLRSQIASLNEKINSSNEIRNELSRQVNSYENLIEGLKKECQEQRERLGEVQIELDQYRTRAQKTLSDKEKLIAELKQALSNNSNGEAVDETVADIERIQLRKELESLQEENKQLAARLTSSREQLFAADARIVTIREEALTVQKKLQDNLQEEIKKRSIVEEDCKLQLEELQAIREELARQQSQLAGRLKEREAELSRLRAQLTQRPISPPPAELETRIHALTKTLVDKQNAVETLMIEKNSLKLQLEKMEIQQRELISRLKQPQGRILSVNDTDDAKAQVPSFFLESPYDTGVARRVKRAYSSLDTFSIRTGVFLRRYPLARIALLPYIAILHLWVFMVLFWYTPDSNSGQK